MPSLPHQRKYPPSDSPQAENPLRRSPLPRINDDVGFVWEAECNTAAWRINGIHLDEWKSSAVAPELARANVQFLRGRSVLEALAGARMEQLGAHAQQYITGRVQRLLAPLDSLAEAGGWWCSGLDPLADWAPMEWGQFKGDRPRQKGGKVLKYEAPVGQPTRSTWLRGPQRSPGWLGTRSGERFAGLQSCRCRHAWTFKLAGSS